MLQPQELRIGNYIRIIYKEIDQVADVLCDSVNTTGGANLYDDIEGIPITSEILKKFGFEKDGFNAYNISVDHFKSDTHFKILSFCGDYLYLKEGCKADPPLEWDIVTIWNKDIMKEFYLHQLQNLFYFITGKELTIKNL